MTKQNAGIFIVLTALFILLYTLQPSAFILFIVGGLTSFILPISIKKTINKLPAILLPIAIIGIGATLNLRTLSAIQPVTLLILFSSIISIGGLGLVMKRLFKLEGHLPLLITIGTAICGATAIMTIAPIIKPKERDMLQALSTLFILNGIALYIFPTFGHLLHLTQQQFGTWAAIAIHDTSSVVGASLSYGPIAVETAVLLKLCRATAIIPLSFFLIHKTHNPSHKTPTFTLFYIFFGLLAVIFLVSALPEYTIIWTTISALSKTCLLLVIFMMGLQANSVTKVTHLKKPFLFGLLLWIITSSASLVVVLMSS